MTREYALSNKMPTKSPTMSEVRYPHMGFRPTAEMVIAIKRESKKRGVKMSVIIKDAVAKYLKLQ